jgi:protein transport protein SEC61 subunit gamma-like protein
MSFALGVAAAANGFGRPLARNLSPVQSESNCPRAPRPRSNSIHTRDIPSQRTTRLSRNHGPGQGARRVRRPHPLPPHALTLLHSVPQEFVKDGLQFVNRCTKPDKREFIKISQAVGVGFLIMGVIGYVVKLIHSTQHPGQPWTRSSNQHTVPVNNILVGGS